MSNGQRIADETLNKIKGTIYGQAIGDALGLGTEGMTDEDMAWKYPNGISHGNRCLSYTAVIHKNEELFQHSSSFILAYQYVIDISSQWYGE